MDTSMFALSLHEKHNSLLKLKDVQSVLIILCPPLLKIEGNLDLDSAVTQTQTSTIPSNQVFWAAR